jgi:GTPase SAR1 family protein
MPHHLGDTVPRIHQVHQAPSKRFRRNGFGQDAPRPSTRQGLDVLASPVIPVAMLTSLASAQIGHELLQRVSPGVVERLGHWFVGRDILAVGQARAGKTSFCEFLRFGTLEAEAPTRITYDDAHKRYFTIRVGREGDVAFRIRRSSDVPGQAGAVAHAHLVTRYRPHALVIVTDLTSPMKGEPDRAAGAWLRLFCEHLAEGLRSSWRTRRALRTIVLVMNKCDQVSEKKANVRAERFREILGQTLSGTYGIRAHEIPILPCALVKTEHGTELADRVVIRLAKALVG